MGSTRLPGKVLLHVNGKPLLEHTLLRLARLRHSAHIVIATSSSEKDNILTAFCEERGVAFFRGSEANVLERYYFCACENKFTQVVRLTADNPFTDIEELDHLIDLHVSTGSDFSHSFQSLPVGVGAEIFKFEALETSYREGQAPHHREHVDEYLLEHPERFKTSILKVIGPKNRPDIRLTVDTEEDYRRVCFIAERVRQDYISTEEAVRVCSEYA